MSTYTGREKTAPKSRSRGRELPERERAEEMSRMTRKGLRAQDLQLRAADLGGI